MRQSPLGRCDTMVRIAAPMGGATTAIRLFSPPTAPSIWPWLRASAALEMMLWIAVATLAPRRLTKIIENINQPWVMFAIIFVNLLGATVATAIQSIISSAADARNQGQMLGAVGGLNSLMTVIAPPIGATILTMVSHLPKGDWRIGAPFYFCAALQAAALVLAVSHFRSEWRERAAAA